MAGPARTGFHCSHSPPPDSIASSRLTCKRWKPPCGCGVQRGKRLYSYLIPRPATAWVTVKQELPSFAAWRRVDLQSTRCEPDLKGRSGFEWFERVLWFKSGGRRRLLWKAAASGAFVGDIGVTYRQLITAFHQTDAIRDQLPRAEVNTIARFGPASLCNRPAVLLLPVCLRFFRQAFSRFRSPASILE